MRIVGGIHKGRALTPPKTQNTRPTSDRTREAMFNILAHSIAGFSIEGTRVLDVFAGTGALGLEALSRGAASAYFIDDSAAARGLVRTNAETLGATGQVKIWRRDATRLGLLDSAPPFDLVFLDPPYNKKMGDKALVGLLEGGWLSPNAVVVLEEAKKAEISIPDGLNELSTRNYGDTKALFLQAI